MMYMDFFFKRLAVNFFCIKPADQTTVVFPFAAEFLTVTTSSKRLPFKSVAEVKAIAVALLALSKFASAEPVFGHSPDLISMALASY